MNIGYSSYGLYCKNLHLSESIFKDFKISHKFLTTCFNLHSLQAFFTIIGMENDGIFFLIKTPFENL